MTYAIEFRGPIANNIIMLYITVRRVKHLFSTVAITIVI